VRVWIVAIGILVAISGVVALSFRSASLPVCNPYPENCSGAGSVHPFFSVGLLLLIIGMAIGLVGGYVRR
jgi:hypothetical protein